MTVISYAFYPPSTPREYSIALKNNGGSFIHLNTPFQISKWILRFCLSLELELKRSSTTQCFWSTMTRVATNIKSWEWVHVPFIPWVRNKQLWNMIWYVALHPPQHTIPSPQGGPRIWPFELKRPSIAWCFLSIMTMTWVVAHRELPHPLTILISSIQQLWSLMCGIVSTSTLHSKTASRGSSDLAFWAETSINCWVPLENNNTSCCTQRAQGGLPHPFHTPIQYPTAVDSNGLHCIHLNTVF